MKITILEQNTKIVIAEVETDQDGWFSCWTPIGKKLIIRAEKAVFHTRERVVSTAGKAEGEKVFANPSESEDS